jgi:hypothetical protein
VELKLTFPALYVSLLRTLALIESTILLPSSASVSAPETIFFVCLVISSILLFPKEVPFETASSFA